MDFKTPNLFVSLLPIIMLIGLLSLNVVLWEDTLSGANQTALMLSAAVAALIAGLHGMSWDLIKEKIVSTIGKAMPSMLILLLIGALAGTWFVSGIVPALIYYGLDLLHPSIFLFSAVIISALVSLATGSSWSTIATIGTALLGIGIAMGFSPALTAGAVISGAYFGDKMSPMSDTTNLAPAMAGTDLFTHIRYMMYTTIPSMGITLVIFLLIGFMGDYSTNIADTAKVQEAITEKFRITPLLFIVPVFLILIIIRKVKPIPALLAGSLLAGIFAVIFQADILEEITKVSNNYAKASYMGVMQAIFGDVKIPTSDPAISKLFSSGGMAGMMGTLWLIISAMIFGGVMEASGMLKKITQSIMTLVNSDGSLIAATAGTSMFFNVTASDQYMSIVVPGSMYEKAYKDRDLKPEVLSRTLEDAGTATSVLVPWNTCGAAQAKILQVDTLAYLPYAFFNIISPIMTIMFGILKIKIRKYKEGENKEKD